MAVFKVKKNYWFFEGFVAYDISEIEIATRIKRKIYSGQSAFQKIDVYDTYTYGRVLILDEVIQTAEKDEFIYHEMLCQPALFHHKKPKKILIVGGGDGGALRQILTHRVDQVCLVEIDKKVIEVSEKYLPAVSGGSFQDKRSKIVIMDGRQYIKKQNRSFDIIILDLSDPDGPARELVSQAFYNDVKKALKKDGILSVQAGSLIYQPGLIRQTLRRLKKIFACLEIRRAVVPSYQDGEYGFILASDKKLSAISPGQLQKRYDNLNLNLKYYCPAIHFAAKVLPPYLKDRFN